MSMNSLSLLLNLINSHQYRSCFNLCISALKEKPDDLAILMILLRALRHIDDLSSTIELQAVISRLLTFRARRGQATMPVLGLVSKLNKLIMEIEYKNTDSNFSKFVRSGYRNLRSRPKILILTCIWKRPEITGKFLAYYSELSKVLKCDFDIRLIAVGSEESVSRQPCEQWGFDYVEHPNDPLTEKWQAGLDAARHFDFDYLLILGSDDFLSKNAFMKYREVIQKGTFVFGFTDMYIMQPDDSALIYWKGYGSSGSVQDQPLRVGETIGLGRLIRREVLEFLNFNLWGGEVKNRSLDLISFQKIMKHTGMLPLLEQDSLSINSGQNMLTFGMVSSTLRASSCMGLDVKGQLNITPIQRYCCDRMMFEECSRSLIEKFGITPDLRLEDKVADVATGHDRECCIAVGIPTFNRPELLNRLVSNLFESARYADLCIKLFIYDDGGHKRFQLNSKNLIHAPNISVFRSEVNNGKQGYWRTVNHIFDELSSFNAEYFFYLPDDVDIELEFFEKALSIWDSIEDAKKISLNLLEDGRDECWTGMKRVRLDFGLASVFRSQWLDMAILFDRKLLRYRVKRIGPERWQKDSLLSSGVGSQLSKRFNNAGYNMYQVISSLLSHGVHESVMNPEERELNPLVAGSGGVSSKLSFRVAKDAWSNKKIVVGVATIENRWNSLCRSLSSISDQVDEIHLYQNGFKCTDVAGASGKIKIVSSLDTGIDRGDAGKFYAVDGLSDCVYFSIDDDLHYPPDYVARTLAYLSFLKKPAVVSYHGRVLRKGATCYYKHVDENYRCLDEVRAVERVQFAGTGVMAFDVDQVPVRFSLFERENMADVWMGILCKEKNIPLYVLPHAAGWITHNEIDLDDTIYSRYRKIPSHVNEILVKRYWCR